MVANGCEKHTESNIREVKEIMGWLVEESIRGSKTFF